MAHIASDFTCVYCAAAGTIFGTTDIYELGFSYLSLVSLVLYSVKIRKDCLIYPVNKFLVKNRKFLHNSQSYVPLNLVEIL